MLFASGVDTSTLTRVDANALHIAAEFSNAAIVQRLMDSGLDPNVIDVRGRNALDYAKKTGGRLAIRGHRTPRDQGVRACCVGMIALHITRTT